MAVWTGLWHQYPGRKTAEGAAASGGDDLDVVLIMLLADDDFTTATEMKRFVGEGWLEVKVDGDKFGLLLIIPVTNIKS